MFSEKCSHRNVMSRFFFFSLWSRCSKDLEKQKIKPEQGLNYDVTVRADKVLYTQVGSLTCENVFSLLNKYVMCKVPGIFFLMNQVVTHKALKHICFSFVSLHLLDYFNLTTQNYSFPLPTCSSGLTPGSSCSSGCVAHMKTDITDISECLPMPGLVIYVCTSKYSPTGRPLSPTHCYNQPVFTELQHTRKLPHVLNLTSPNGLLNSQFNTSEVCRRTQIFISSYWDRCSSSCTLCNSSTGRWRFKVLRAVKSVTKCTCGQFFNILMVARDFKCR